MDLLAHFLLDTTTTLGSELSLPALLLYWITWNHSARYRAIPNSCRYEGSAKKVITIIHFSTRLFAPSPASSIPKSGAREVERPGKVAIMYLSFFCEITKIPPVASASAARSRFSPHGLCGGRWWRTSNVLTGWLLDGELRRWQWFRGGRTSRKRNAIPDHR